MKKIKIINRLIAIFLAFIILTLPLTEAQFITPVTTTPKEENIGAAITLIAKDYEPKTVSASMIESTNVPVQVLLAGYTPGSLLFGKGSPTTEPFIGVPKINAIIAYPSELSQKYIVGTPGYVAPSSKAISLDNLGYLVIWLKKIEKEHEVPDEINLNMTLRIYFDMTRAFGDISMQDLILKEQGDEALWRSGLEKQDFWNKKGYVRASQITETRATINIYDAYLRNIATVNLNEDEFSPILILPGASTFFNDRFRIKLDKISEPETKARIRAKIAGTVYEKALVKGMRIYPGSEWVVDEIYEETQAKKGEFQEQVRIRNLKGDTMLLTLTYTAAPSINIKEVRQKLESAGVKSDEIKIFNDFISTGAVKKTLKTIGDNIEFASKYTYNSFLNIVKILSRSVWESLVLITQRIDLNDEEIKTKEDIICSENDIVKDEDLDTEKDVLKFYCTSIAELKKVPVSYAGSGYEDDAYFYVAENYYEMGDLAKTIATAKNKKEDEILFSTKILARHYYKKVLNFPESTFLKDAQNKIDQIENELNIRTETIWLDDENAEVTLKEVIPISPQDKSSADIEIDGSSYKYSEGVSLFSGTDYKLNKKFVWEITKIRKDVVTVARKIDNMIEDPTTLPLGKTVQLTSEINKDGKITQTKSVRTRNTDTKIEAAITVYPGSGRVYSESNVTIHLNIEKRPIELTPDKINSLINQTQKQIDKLNLIIDRLNKIVTGWRATCLVTFSLLTIKNSFLGGLTRKQARRDIMPSYKEICTRGVETGEYKTFDKCMSEFADKIEKELDVMQGAIDKANSYMKNKEYESVIKGYDQLNKNTGITIIEPTTLRERKKWEYYKDNAKDEKLRSYAEEQFRNLDETINNKKLAHDIAVAKVQGITATDYSNKKLEERSSLVRQFNDIFSSVVEARERTIPEKERENIKSKANSELGITIVDVIPTVYLGNVGYIMPKEIKSDKDIQEIKNLGKVRVEDLKDSKIYKEINEQEIAADIKLQKLKEPVVIDGRELYKSGNQYYLATSTLYEGAPERRLNYANGATAEFDKDGKPYCIPTRNGNYAKVLEYFPLGDPKTVEEWNVGQDGRLCTNDDGIVHHRSELDRPELTAKRNELFNTIARTPKCKEGDHMGTAEKIFTCSQQRFKAQELLKQPSCYEVMDPSDCRLLFNTCDPVMCPPSRFNMGGRWQVSNVVETGIIGSIALGPLQEFPEEPVPICLTGILASLRNWKSLLEGFRECLYSAKAEDKSIGICNTIRSIGVCELIWREAIAILDVQGGLLGYVAEKIQGGGEYLTFKDSLQNVGDSVNYFTKQYASTAFAAFTSRSTEEIGTFICRTAIFGKLPELSEFLNQLTVPENPPQFTAFFDETPFTEITTTAVGGLRAQSRYQIYYHIYAGTIPEKLRTSAFVQRNEISYAVFLKDDFGNIVDATEAPETGVPLPGLKYRTVPYGGFVDKSIEFPAISGLNQICVDINGRVECGFGKVTTAFGIKSLNDALVKDEALREKITSEKQCVPDFQKSSPTLQSLVLPRQYGLLSTGIVRVCSTNNPGIGTGRPGDWQEVGTCGKDEEGRSLGKCWIDTKTIGTNDIEAKRDIMQKLQFNKEQKENQALDYKAFMENLYGIKDSEQILASLDFKFEDIKKVLDKNPEELNNQINPLKELLSKAGTEKQEDYRSITTYSVDFKSKARAQVQIGKIYLKIGGWLKSLKQEEQKKAEKPSTQTKKTQPITTECGIKEIYLEKDGRKIGKVDRIKVDDIKRKAISAVLKTENCNDKTAILSIKKEKGTISHVYDKVKVQNEEAKIGTSTDMDAGKYFFRAAVDNKYREIPIEIFPK